MEIYRTDRKKQDLYNLATGFSSLSAVQKRHEQKNKKSSRMGRRRGDWHGAGDPDIYSGIGLYVRRGTIAARCRAGISG